MKLFLVVLLALLVLVHSAKQNNTEQISKKQKQLEMLNEFHLFKAAVQWFLQNEDYLNNLDENALRSELIHAMKLHNSAYKDSKTLNKALILILNSKKQRQHMKSRTKENIQNINKETISHKSNSIPFKWG